jgi:23S rRNA G2445 N2-methylase RlmL
MKNKIYLNWEDVNTTWDQVLMVWDDVSIIMEVGNIFKKGGGGGYPSREEIQEYIKGNPWNVTKNRIQESIGEEKTKKFIKILCKVNNIDYESIIESKDNILINIDQIEKVFSEEVKVDVKI